MKHHVGHGEDRVIGDLKEFEAVFAHKKVHDEGTEDLWLILIQNVIFDSFAQVGMRTRGGIVVMRIAFDCNLELFKLL